MAYLPQSHILGSGPKAFLPGRPTFTKFDTVELSRPNFKSKVPSRTLPCFCFSEQGSISQFQPLTPLEEEGHSLTHPFIRSRAEDQRLNRVNASSLTHSLPHLRAQTLRYQPLNHPLNQTHFHRCYPESLQVPRTNPSAQFSQPTHTDDRTIGKPRQASTGNTCLTQGTDPPDPRQPSHHKIRVAGP